MKKVFTIIILAFTIQSNAQVLTKINGEGVFENKPAEFMGTLVFKSTTTLNGEGLYKIDGVGNLVFIKSLIGDVSDFIETNGKLFFVYDDGSHGKELWVTDGSSLGTALVKDINPGFNDGIREEIWSGCFGVGSGFGSNPWFNRVAIGFQNKLYFIGIDGTHGRELWSSDGTANGTQMVMDIYSGSNDGICEPNLTIFQNHLYFQAHSSNGDEIWKTDGNGNTEATIIAYGSLYVFLNSLWSDIDNYNSEIYVNDSTGGGSTLFLGNPIKDESGVPLSFGGNTFLLTPTSTDTFQLVRSDFSQIFYVASQGLSDFKIIGSKLFFVSAGSGGNYFLYSNDIDTIESTVPIQLARVNDYPGYPYPGLEELNGKLFFVGKDNFGSEPWITDGTLAGTNRIKDINPGAPDGIYEAPLNSVLYNGNLYFSSATSSSSENTLWRSNGADIGTSRVATLDTFYTSFYNDFQQVFNGCLYFMGGITSGGFVWDINSIYRYCDGASSINDIGETEISLYPNPATNQLFIQTNGVAVSEINIYNTTGSLVNQTKQPQTKSIDISQLANGVYIAEIKTKEGSAMRRWVKM